ncbi:universal stress protein [Pelagibius sp. Alg239-R121]|uniref:universal stress protein n=1 Tax=Pelagibius sp. Alg239-R121 TaxID=2993448 RepID=UPI0024A7152B|nr:universal stress protein [Pelagibius sp. Alg239-R121]
MTVKTILVHLADDEEHLKRLEVALTLAEERKAHVTALFITTPIGMPAEITGRGASAAYLSEATAQARKTAEALEEEFDARCERSNIEYSWITTEGDHLDLLARHAHAADLVIASQPTYDSLEDRLRMRLPEELALHSGLPVLVLPRDENIETIGKRILVAWKDTRETVRAVRDNMSLLIGADKVFVLTVAPDAYDALSLHEVAKYLERHGVNVDTQNIANYEESVGQTILDVADSCDVDLIVIGAHGHSRLRELIMGSVTDHILKTTERPVVISH